MPDHMHCMVYLAPIYVLCARSRMCVCVVRVLLIYILFIYRRCGGLCAGFDGRDNNGNNDNIFIV